MKKHHRDFLILLAVGLFVLLGLAFILHARIINSYMGRLIMLGAINTIVALSLNLITGFTGQLALGQAGFVGLGAYTTAIMTSAGIPLPFALVGAVLVAALGGFLIGWPSLRLRGDYLAIMTLGFGEILRSIITNLTPITGGASGFKDIPPFMPDPDMNRIVGFFWIFGLMLVVIALVSNLIRSSHGRALISIREDETASNSMGINIALTKIGAFTLSAGIAGLGGALQAPFLNYLAPSSFDFLKSVDIVVIIVLGGMGSITGTVISAFTLTFLQELLRFLRDYRTVIYPLLMILMMLFRPQGILGKHEWSITGFFDRLKKLRSPKEKPHG